MKTLFMYLIFAFSASVFGSDIKHCKIIGEVTSIDEAKNLTVQVHKATPIEISYVDCQEFVETTVYVTANERKYSEGDIIALEYLYTADLTPQGVQVFESLEIVE